MAVSADDIVKDYDRDRSVGEKLKVEQRFNGCSGY